MVKAFLALVLALTLSSCDGDSHDSAPNPAPNPGTAMLASAWEIGPVIDGRNYSIGLPLHPIATPDGWAFDLSPTSSVHYVTARLGSLNGKSRIVMRYRIEADPGVELRPSTGGEGAPSIGPTMYFQRKGDQWGADGWRWWSTFAAPSPIVPGEFELAVPLDGPWTSVERMTAMNNPTEFLLAKVDADRVGFTFGGGTGYGHGVYATGHARVIVTDFRLE